VTSNRFATRGAHYAVATPHEAATQAAVEVFRSGGNAADAAVTANAVLTVVYPHMCGIGGDCFAIVSDAGGATVINGSGAAAMALNANDVRREHGSMPIHGPLSVSVPGTIAAWDAVLRRYGRRPFGAIFDAAVRYARDGVAVAGSVARGILKHRADLEADPGLRSLFLPAGRALTEKDVLRQPGLAATLEAISAEGPGVFYRGPVGERFIAGLRALGSPLAMDDLRAHETEMVSPLVRRYRDLGVLVPPPNSQGFVLEEILGCIEEGRIDPDHLGVDASMIARLFLLASADRDRFLADPRKHEVPVEQLLSGTHAGELLAGARTGITARPVSQPAGGDTVGIVAADDSGLWVSINQSLYDGFGSGILETQTGIIPHNRGSYFSLDPQSPDVLEGGKRPAHTLMPVMVTRERAPIIASATMGGSAHAQIHTELLTTVIDQRQGAWTAIERPRWLVGGTQRDGGSGVVAESRVSDRVTDGFRRSGIDVAMLADWDEQVGHAQLLVRGIDGQFEAASDPRADGAAAAG
jgi:gamma-glutamyltranspeptidase